MNWLLGSGLVGSIGVIAGLSIGVVWFSRKAIARADELGAARETVVEHRRALDAHRGTIEDLKKALGSKESELAREIVGRKRVEQQRNVAIKKLVSLGDPGGVSAAIRVDIERLQTLSGLPNIPGTGTKDS